MNFTIIIPHKDTPRLLVRLIESIPVRDDLEIIVVDDYSDSDVVKCLQKLDRKNLKLILNQECHGAGYARNCALPIVRGKWILFADSDDFFNEGFNDFLNEYLDSDADIIYFNANSVDSETLETSNRVDHLHDFIDEFFSDRNRGELVMRYLFTEPWCKMVKREIIENNQIRFEETSIRNDVRYSYLVGYYANKILVDPRQLYCVTSRKDSVSKRMGPQASLDELKVFAGWKKFFMDKKIPIELPKFDLRMYNFTRYLWKDFSLFQKEYRMLRIVGISRSYIIKQIIIYLWKSVRYKLKM